MDRIALISDIHGNIPALEATLDDIRRRGIVRIFCLGDLGGKGPHGEKVVDICREVHASQKSEHYRVRQPDPVEKLLAMFENTDFTGRAMTPDVVGYGDIHEAYLRSFLGKTLFNVGSVGNANDIPQASYGILEGTYGSDIAAPLGIHLVRVPYDIELAIRQATDEDMPSLEPYAHELRTAKYRGARASAQEREAVKKLRGVE